MDVDTDTLWCTIMFSSAKALRVMTEEGKVLWIPKSIIHSEYYEFDPEVEQELTVETWLLRREGLVTY